jgi:arsenate reductase
MRQPRGAHHVLFLCRDNAVLSPMAEALLNHWGRGRFSAWSAGWQPAPGVHALAVRVMRRAQVVPAFLRPRSWSELGGPDAPEFRFLVLLGPELPDAGPFPLSGAPLLARWQIVDPTGTAGPPEAQERAFALAFHEIEARVKLFAGLSLDGLGRLAAERRLAEIEVAAATS